MLKRREFLKQSAAAAVASTGIPVLTTERARAGIANASVPPEPVRFVIVDERFEDSVAFGDELVARGARVFALQDDVGRLWFGELGRAFTVGASLAGLTSNSDMLVCAAFARQHAARVRYEGSHDCRGSEFLIHTLRLGAHEPVRSAQLAAADAHWPRALAACLSGMSSHRQPMREDRCVTSTRRADTHPGSLFSWLIA